MRKSIRWINLSLMGLCALSFTGFLLRSKFIFALPRLNYNYLLEAHAHFTFCGWISLALMTLLADALLPAALSNRPVYQWLLALSAMAAWGMLLVFAVEGYRAPAGILFMIFTAVSYVYSWVLARDLLRSPLESPVRLAALGALSFLVLSSAGAIAITYIHLAGSSDVVLFRNALVTYLHFQYNGFFSLAILALLFRLMGEKMERPGRERVRVFVHIYSVSVLPSLFLSYLWGDAGALVRGLAMAGCVLTLVSLYFFLRCTGELIGIFRNQSRTVRFLAFLSLAFFMLKMLLQGFTLFPGISQAIFGSRPIIMGFLHMVFLGFASLFLLAYMIMRGMMDGRSRLVKLALATFASAVILNEGLLMLEGLTGTLGLDSTIYLYLLWWAGVLLFTGSLLILLGKFLKRNP